MTVAAAHLTHVDSDPAGAVAPVAEMLRAFGRALRAHALYRHDNPAYLRSVEQAVAAFDAVWEVTEEVVLSVRENELHLGDAVVHADAERTSDGLAWMLYKDGVRELVLQAGLHRDELLSLIDTLHQVRRASPDDDDLVTMLWERDLPHVRHRCVDAEPPHSDAMQPPDAGSRSFGSIAEMAATGTASQIVRMEEFESTLYFLDQAEIEYLRSTLAAEYQTDVRSSVIDALLDTFEHQRSPRVRDEIAAAVDTLLVQALVAAAFGAAAHLLTEAAASANRAPEIGETHRDRLLGLTSRLSEPNVLTQLVQAIDDASDTFDLGQAETLLQTLDVAALQTLLRLVPTVERERVRQAIDRAIVRIAGSHTQALVRLIAHEDAAVSLGAIRHAALLRTPAAVGGLTQRLTTGDLQHQQQAAEALAAIGSPGSLQALERVVDAEDRALRLSAYRAFAQHRYRAVLPRIEGLIRGREARERDLTEKMALFEAYGTLCGDGGIPYLDGVLNARGFLGRRPDAEVRACAAVALGRIRSPAAHAVLARASEDRDVVVRTAVTRALRGATA